MLTEVWTGKNESFKICPDGFSCNIKEPQILEAKWQSKVQQMVNDGTLNMPGLLLFFEAYFIFYFYKTA